MNQISYNGAFNSATLNVPGVYLNIVPPKGAIVRPALVGILAIIGVASWGPVNVAKTVGSPAELASLFGAQAVRKYDLVTHAALALQVQAAVGSGAGLVLVRATDGTDTAAAVDIGLTGAGLTLGVGGTGYPNSGTATLANGITITFVASAGIVTGVTLVSGAATSQPTNPVATTTPGAGTGLTVNVGSYTKQLTLTSIYTGSAANGATATIGTGTLAGSSKITINMPGIAPEVFDNIAGAANAFWVNAASAINNGNSPQRGPSRLVVATAGTATTAATNATSILAGGTDGAGATASNLVGADGSSRTGVYALRGLGCSHGVVADLDDHAQNTTLASFAQSEGIYWGVQNAAGDTPSAAATQKASDGTDNPFLKLYLGDWTYVNDNVNGQQRLIGPATLGMATLSTLQPQQSGLNKQVPLVVATQRSKTGAAYSQADLATLINAGLEVITNPIPRGAMFGHPIGRSSSSDQTRNTDNWPVLTSFIARSLTGPGALGPAIGEVITDDFFDTWYAVLDNFLGGLKGSTPYPTIQAYQINFSRANNPQNQTAKGLVVAEVLVQYFGIAQVFLVNLQSGATVVIPVSQSSFAAAA